MDSRKNDSFTTATKTHHQRTASGAASVESSEPLPQAAAAEIPQTTTTTTILTDQDASAVCNSTVAVQQPHQPPLQAPTTTAVVLAQSLPFTTSPPLHVPGVPLPAAAVAASTLQPLASILPSAQGASHGGGGGGSGGASKIVQRPAVFDKLEALVQDMQDKAHGVPVRHQKVFLTSIPFAFMGYDLIEWLMDRLCIEDSLEAVHLANLLCQFGYYFPIGELKNLLVKDDSSLYRFQSPYYWPSQHHTPDNIEYAIYLAKRSQQRKREKHGLEDYEVEAYNNLKKILANKWEFVTMQADEQLKVAKDRKRDDKQIVESQERAYWRVYRPPPGYTTVVESSPVPTREHRVKARSRTKEHILEEVKFVREYVSTSRCKVSFVAENLIDYTETFFEFDPMLVQPGPSNPWITDDQTHWLLNQPIVDTPTEKRVRKWELSLEDLVSDPLGVKELMEYMKKEYSHENLRFWGAVQELRYGPGTEAKIKKKVKEIWDEFLAPGAKAEINIDGKTMEATKLAMKNPTRFTFEVAAGHVFLLLLKKDCYPRFIRSESYKTILANAVNPGNVKRRIFNFPKVPKRQQQQKPGTSTTGVSGTNTQISGRLLEDFNVYGIHGATGDISDSPPDGTDPEVGFSPKQTNKAENVCPWELDDNLIAKSKGDCKKATPGSSGGSVAGHVRRGSDPTALASSSSAAAAAKTSTAVTSVTTKSTRIVHPSETAAALVAAAVTTPLETTRPSKAPTKRASSTSSDQEKSNETCILDPGGSKSSHEPRHRHSESGTSSAQSHHHHHHHHHHHVASRRTKNRSRKKKPSRAASSTVENDLGMFSSPAAKQHDPPTHQHSAASLLTSVAVTSVAMASMEIASNDNSTSQQQQNSSQQQQPSTNTPTTAAATTACATASTASDNELHQAMETKCTQTKLDDEVADQHLLILASSRASSASVVTASAPEVTSELTRVLDSNATDQDTTTTTGGGSNEIAGSEQQSAAAAAASSTTPVASSATAMAAPTAAESKGEIGTWTSSTEVCPWEDDTLTPTWL